MHFLFIKIKGQNRLKKSLKLLKITYYKELLTLQYINWNVAKKAIGATVCSLTSSLATLIQKTSTDENNCCRLHAADYLCKIKNAK